MCRFYAWGSNNDAMLTFGELINENYSEPTLTTLVNFSYIRGGDNFACGFISSSVRCWGSNSAGQLGRGASFDDLYSATPSNISAGLYPPTLLAVGGSHGCFRRNGLIAAYVACWGLNSDAQLGNDSQINSSSAVAVYNIPSRPYAKVYAGSVNSCAALSDGSLFCWGDNTYGQVGASATVGPVKRPTQTLAPTDGGTNKYSMVAIGLRNVCGVDTSSKLYCWGAGSLGMNGNQNLASNLDKPMTSIMDATGASELSGMGNTAYLRMESGAVYSWGDNGEGQAALGPDGDSIVEQPTLTPMTGVTAVSSGSTFVCMLVSVNDMKSLKCVGNNTNGQLGNGTTNSSAAPVTVYPAYSCDWATIYASANSMFAGQVAGTVRSPDSPVEASPEAPLPPGPEPPGYVTRACAIIMAIP